MRFLKYLFILAEIFAAADNLSAVGTTGMRVVRGIRYHGGEFELNFTIKRLA